MKKYLCFFAVVLLLSQASTASAILIDYKTMTIATEEVSGNADPLFASDAMTVKASVERDDFFHSNFESIVLKIVGDMLRYPQYPPHTFNAPNETSVSPIPEPSTIVLMGLGLVGLAKVGRRHFKK